MPFICLRLSLNSSTDNLSFLSNSLTSAIESSELRPNKLLVRKSTNFLDVI